MLRLPWPWLLVITCAGCGAHDVTWHAAPAPPRATAAPAATAASDRTPQPLPATPPPAGPSAALLQAVAAADRPEQDRVRDADRRPAEVLAFLGIEPGMRVADLMAGRGYYSEILARALGPTGQLYVQNNAFVVKRFADEALGPRLSRPGLERAIRWDRELDALGFAPGSLDACLMVLFYHDTFWQNVDRPAMLAQVLAALKPGGVFGLLDHHARAGTGERDVETLHRVDAALVVREVSDAGFLLRASSELLRNPDDTRDLNVFDPAIRGKTDRFLYRFEKPK